MVPNRADTASMKIQRIQDGIRVRPLLPWCSPPAASPSGLAADEGGAEPLRSAGRRSSDTAPGREVRSGHRSNRTRSPNSASFWYNSQRCPSWRDILAGRIGCPLRGPPDRQRSQAVPGRGCHVSTHLGEVRSVQGQRAGRWRLAGPVHEGRRTRWTPRRSSPRRMLTAERCWVPGPLSGIWRRSAKMPASGPGALSAGVRTSAPRLPSAITSRCRTTRWSTSRPSLVTECSSGRPPC